MPSLPVARDASDDLDFQPNCHDIDFMRCTMLICSLMLSLLELGCCSSGATERATPGGSAETATARHAPPNMIQQNLATVEGVVDTVALTGPTDFRLSMLIRSTGTQANGFAAQGEHLTLSPQYQLTDSGTIDAQSARNAGLLKLRSAKRGDVVRGKISLTSDGRWVLLEAHDQ
jgi:hypothetical protein